MANDNNSIWWRWLFSQKGNYHNTLIDFKKHKVIHKKDYDGQYTFWDSDIILFFIAFIFMFFLFIFLLIYGLFFRKHFEKNVMEYTNNFEERIIKLDKWVDVWKKSVDYTPKISREVKLDWAFERIMVVDYALRKNLKIIPTIEKYKLLNERQRS